MTDDYLRPGKCDDCGREVADGRDLVAVTDPPNGAVCHDCMKRRRAATD